MNILLQRQLLTTDWTMGELSVDGKSWGWTLEDAMRETLGEDGNYHWSSRLKLQGRTAIPAGRYETVVTYSNRFKRLLPLLIGVPDFEGIRVHEGNTVADTDGCILLGRHRDVDHGRVWDCAILVSTLMLAIQERGKGGKVWMEIKNP